MASEKRMPTSRAGRAAMLGRVVAGQAARQVGTRVAVAGRGEERKTAALERRHIEAARALVAALGTMRGAAMKIGQVLSIMDAGLFPEEVRDEIQKMMAQLRDSAPNASFDKMRKVIEQDLGERIGKVFAEFDETPLAAASIGQVYRARLRDGREVAVKVQYPGVDKAIRADLGNMAMIMRAMKLLTPNVDVASLTREIRDRIEEELDYELEAQNQRRVARLYRGHPFVVIPDVITELCGPHVLVTEYYEGMRFEELKEADEATRNRVGEIVFRFYVGGVYLHRQFSPDPHPGNFLVGDDGRVAFLDFGLYKHLDQASVETQRAVLRGVIEGDPDRMRDTLIREGFMADPKAMSAEDALEFFQLLFWWAAEDDLVALDPDTANDALAATIHPSSGFFDAARKQSVPTEQVLILRMLAMVLAALGHMRATGNWHRIVREWLYGDEPMTELGVIEAEFRRGDRPGKAAM
ncbi:ABC1 kinase family protein [Smaragdicoccus niigatensis]|uniref:ABC1 kinase family protein n=1 Tax=Smaragdicoccus niigatensis TaxID=359359 RepID=UPI00036327C3|nr:AarF/ABC1/UbiB kinase family protein [Smaragdicoccus niigatensis]